MVGEVAVIVVLIDRVVASKTEWNVGRWWCRCWPLLLMSLFSKGCGVFGQKFLLYHSFSTKFQCRLCSLFIVLIGSHQKMTLQNVKRPDSWPFHLIVEFANFKPQKCSLHHFSARIQCLTLIFHALLIRYINWQQPKDDASKLKESRSSSPSSSLWQSCSFFSNNV